MNQTMRALWFTAMLGLTLSLAGCPSAPKPVIDGLPSWSEMAPPRETEVDTTELGREATNQRYLVRLVQLDLPIKAELTAARQHLTPAMTPAMAEVDLWHANGLFAGTLAGEDFEKFIATLPAAPAVHRDRIVMPAGTVPLPVSPPLRGGSVTFEMTTVSGLEMVQVGKGQLQFHLSVEAVGGGGPVVTLTPHHYFPQPTIEPRLPQVKALDGESFEALALRVTMEPGQVLVVGLEPPPPPPPAPDVAEPMVDEEPTTVTDEAGPTNPEDAVIDAAEPPVQEVTPEKKAPPPRLGDTILSMKRFGHPVQAMLLISVEPLPRATANTRPESPPAPAGGSDTASDTSPDPNPPDTGVR